MPPPPGSIATPHRRAQTIVARPAAPIDDDDDALRIYRWMYTVRRIDAKEKELVACGAAHFHVAASGHEASAALAVHLQRGDYLHAHYRDKALMLAMGLPLREFFDSLLCNAASHSGGRQMSAHLSAPHLNILSTVGPVGNNALQAVSVAQQLAASGSTAIVVCSMGDGTTQQGEVLEAIAEAVRSRLPVLFLVHDNRYAISTPTKGKTFYSQPGGDAPYFYGLPIHRINGLLPEECRAGFGSLVGALRAGAGPALCLMSVERLTDHTNADDESAYRSAAERSLVSAHADPLLRARRELLAGRYPRTALELLHAAIDAEVEAAAQAALAAPPPVVEPVIPPVTAARAAASTSPRPIEHVAGVPLTMAQALRQVLDDRLCADPRVTLYGQDIEDPKGDVFGVTRGLSTAHPGRVSNAPLSESTIVGTSIGRALAGGRPVAFLQFADFLPLAFNQLATELATLSWRTRGGWQAPVILIVSSGAYRPRLADRQVWNSIRHDGNTSSSSIPLALTSALLMLEARRIGLCAFGAGYTQGAAILER